MDHFSLSGFQNGNYGLETPIDSLNSNVKLRPSGSVSSTSRVESTDSLVGSVKDCSSKPENAATAPIITIAATIAMIIALFNYMLFATRSINLSVKKRNLFLF